MTTEIQQNRYDQLLRRVGGLIGPGAKVNEVLAELFPVLEVENTTPELLALSGWRLAWSGRETLPDVGNPSSTQLFNPVDSGVIAAVTQVMVEVDGNLLLTGGINTTPLGGTPVRGVFRDSRYGGDRETTLFTDSINGLAVGIAGGWNQRVLNEILVTIRDDNGLVVLAPGSGLVFQPSGNNRRLTIAWFWRERPAEPSELNF